MASIVSCAFSRCSSQRPTTIDGCNFFLRTLIPPQFTLIDCALHARSKACPANSTCTVSWSELPGGIFVRCMIHCLWLAVLGFASRCFGACVSHYATRHLAHSTSVVGTPKDDAEPVSVGQRQFCNMRACTDVLQRALAQRLGQRTRICRHYVACICSWTRAPPFFPSLSRTLAAAI